MSFRRSVLTRLAALFLLAACTAPTAVADAGATSSPRASSAAAARKVCTPGQDQSCNENPEMNALAGICNPDGTCTCNRVYTLQASGRCN